MSVIQSYYFDYRMNKPFAYSGCVICLSCFWSRCSTCARDKTFYLNYPQTNEVRTPDRMAPLDKFCLTNIFFAGLHNISQCTSCTESHFCEFAGKTKETGLCEKGYFCVRGSKSKKASVCPSGQYCPTGTAVPKDCPRGTFYNTTGLWHKDGCTNCTASQYCDGEGLTHPSGDCRAGYYCPTGSDVDNQVPCPIGLHCPGGMFKF